MDLDSFMESLSVLQVLLLFTLICVVHLIIIIRLYKRDMRRSNGCYKNSGQDIIFLCDMEKEKVLHKLSRQRYDDTLYYDFFVKDGKYYIHVKGIKKYGGQDIVTRIFEVKLEYGRKGLYLIISSVNKWHKYFTSKYEIELYEFITSKIVGAIPVEAVQ